MQGFECPGFWFLPETPDTRVPGTLRVSAAGKIELDLIGSLGETGVSRTTTFPYILGLAKGDYGDEITLAGCFQIHAQTGSSSIVLKTYHANSAFLGAHLSQPDDFRFRQMEVRIAGLQWWARSGSGFRMPHHPIPDSSERSPVLLYTQFEPVVGRTPKGGEVSLEISLIRSSSMASGYHITEEPRFIVKPPAPLSPTDLYRDFLSPLRNLITFAAGEPQDVEEIVLRREDILVATTDNPEIRWIAPLSQAADESEGSDERKTPFYLFTPGDIEGGFARLIDRWFTLTTRFASACSLFFGLENDPPAYVDFRFSGLVKVLTFFYLRTPEGDQERRHETALVEKILGKLENSDVQHLRDHIKSRPLPPLHRILDRLLSQHSALMDPLLPDGRLTFRSEVVATVEYYDDREMESPPKAGTGPALYYMTEKLRILMKLCLLEALGFPDEKIQALMRKNGDYMHLVQRERTRHPAGD